MKIAYLFAIVRRTSVELAPQVPQEDLNEHRSSRRHPDWTHPINHASHRLSGARSSRDLGTSTW
jgi:hypothetical protein